MNLWLATLPFWKSSSSGWVILLMILVKKVYSFQLAAWKWHLWHRNIVKEQQKTSAVIAKRKQENAARESQDLPPAYKGEELTMATNPALTKLLASEPARLESLILERQILSFSEQVEEFAGENLTESYLVTADDFKD